MMSDAVILFDKKMGKDQAACIDLKTGELLWSSDRYQLSTFIKANAASFEQMFLDVPEKDGFIVVLKEELIFVALNHDIGKMGFPGEGNETYIPNDSEWHRKNLGKEYNSIMD